MIDLKTLRDDCALMLHDPDYNEISALQWMVFLRSASMDARNKGWLVDAEDDESLTADPTEYSYTVPSNFAYIDQLLMGETAEGSTIYVMDIPRNHWTLRLNGGVPVIAFVTTQLLVPNESIKVIGQKRPTMYTSPDEPVDGGMESFLRERALYYAFRFTGAGSSELAAFRRQQAQLCLQNSEEMLRRHPQEFRMHPSARVVPGRN